MNTPHPTNSTAMLLDARKWAQHYHTRVMDPAIRVRVAEACADSLFQAQIVKAFGDLRGEVFGKLCVEVTAPGLPRSCVAIASRRPHVKQPISHTVNGATAGLAMMLAVCLFTGVGPGSLTSSIKISPRRISEMVSTGRRIISTIGRRLIPRPSAAPDRIAEHHPGILLERSRSEIDGKPLLLNTHFELHSVIFATLAERRDKMACFQEKFDDEGPKKRKVSPEDDEDDMTPSRLSKRVKLSEPTSAREDDGKEDKEESASGTPPVMSEGAKDLGVSTSTDLMWEDDTTWTNGSQ